MGKGPDQHGGSFGYVLWYESLSAFEPASSLSCQARAMEEGFLAAEEDPKHTNSVCTGRSNWRYCIEKILRRAVLC